MQRFAGPTLDDETYICNGCGLRFHYLALDDKNLCHMCRPEPEPDLTETETNQSMNKLYQPAGDYLLVKLDKSVEDIKAEQGTSEGGIVLPASVKDGDIANRPVTGTIVAAGPDAFLGKTQDGVRPLTSGDRVDFFLFRGFPRILDGVHYVQINANQILGLLPESQSAPVLN